MKLHLNNIAKIEDACIGLNGITVIAGENNTGKSTVGRALFAVFNSLYNIHAQIEKERTDSVVSLLTRLLIIANFGPQVLEEVNEAAKEIIENSDSYKNHKEQVHRRISILLTQSGDDQKHINEDVIEETTSRIVEILNISDEKFIETILNKRLQAEFYGQICNVYSENAGSIELTIKNSKIIVSITADGAVKIQNDDAISLHTEVIYLDDPFVLDDFKKNRYSASRSAYYDHRSHLSRKLFDDNPVGNLTDEIIAKDRLGRIYDKVSAVCDGEIIANKQTGLAYSLHQSDKLLDVRNLSTGLKTFVILKTLLNNGTITQNGTIILDEPEIHLHPEWQLLFAELVVLIQKEFGIHILLNTHSPYFLNAIEVYAAKYGVAEKCKYYLALTKNKNAVLKDVTNCTEEIYSKLARPLQVLEDERGNL